jgi:dihydrolipoamide dehydrogenase
LAESWGKMQNQYDITILGAGPAGYVAAIRAAQAGAKVLVIEKDKLGGTCLNRGCVPTKSFLSDVKAYYQVKTSAIYEGKNGLSIDFEKMVIRKNQVVAELTKGIGSLLKSHGIEVIQGEGSFIDSKQITVKRNGHTEVYKANHVIIATGSRVAVVPNVTFDGENILSSDEILNIQAVPKEIVIIGGGVIGIEFAVIFNALGTQVTVLEMLPGIISTEDDQIIGGLTTVLERRGIKILTGIKVMGASLSGNGVQVTVEEESGKKGKLVTEKVLVAGGRVPNTDGLEKLDLQKDGKFIRVNARMETNRDHVYAIGDVIGKVMQAHAASAEGTIAVENIMGGSREINYLRIPNCIYTFPEVASVGLKEREAREKGLQINVGYFPFQYNTKAIAVGKPEGFVKIVVDKTFGEIMGCHILGENATDLISECVTLMSLEVTVKNLAGIIKGHPTFSEAVMEAFGSCQQLAIHLPGRNTIS